MTVYPSRDYTDKQFEAEFFEACLTPGEFVYSNGDSANHKVIVGNIRRNPELEHELVSRLGDLVLAESPGFVAGVPRGGTWLAEQISLLTGIALVKLKDSADGESMELEDDFIDGKCTLEADTINEGVVIEDTFRTFKKTRMALAVPAIARKKIVAAVAAIDRGDPQTRDPLGIRHRAVINGYIPAILPYDHELAVYLK